MNNLAIHKHWKPAYSGVKPSDAFSPELFHEVQSYSENNFQVALHTNLGSLTVLDRLTGFGWRDIETGYRAPDGDFWLASGGIDVRESDAKTMQDAIDWVKSRANNCIPEPKEIQQMAGTLDSLNKLTIKAEVQP